MKKSESIVNLAMALCQFQGEVTNPKNTAANPFFKSKYCPLNDVINLVRPILAKNGLSVLQSPSSDDGEKIIITTILLHSSGEYIEFEPLILKADKVTAQGAGSAITYGRRYALSAILGIASEEDDDANHATGNKEGKSQDKTKTEIDSGKSDTKADGKCSACSNTINGAVRTFSEKQFGKALCRSCQDKQQKGA